MEPENVGKMIRLRAIISIGHSVVVCSVAKARVRKNKRDF